MTSYFGGKQRLGKKLADVIWIVASIVELERGITFKGYCEPFCGMLGVYGHIPELFKAHEPVLKYKAGDINKSVVMMWKKAQKGWKPPTRVTEVEYNKIKTSKNSALKGYIGHQYSFAGKYFEGFSPKYGKSYNSTFASNRVHNISHNLKHVTFSHGSYDQYSDLQGYIIYCDPPYENTTSPYHDETGKTVQFDHSTFWAWCRKMAVKNLVFISSYKAPRDFSCIWSQKHKISGYKIIENTKRTERLYMA